MEFDTEKFNELMAGVLYNAVFIPKSVSRNKDEKNPSINWSITLIRNGQTLALDYSHGTGCVSENDDKFIRRLANVGSISRQNLDRRRIEADMCESGMIRSLDNLSRSKKLDKPKLSDVFHCVLLDGSAIDEGGFENWCANLGYDTDSRKAEKAYHACVETGCKLRGMFGDKLEQLRELFQDY